MLEFYMITAVLVAPMLAACGSSKAVTTPGMVESERRDQPSTKDTEAAQGDLREAMLVLRRVHFAYDSATLQPAARDALAKAAEPLKNHPDVQLYIDGHADERGTPAYNVVLGQRRARAVIDALTRLGIAGDRLHLNSYGKAQPLSNGHGMMANATNRRVDFRLFRGDVRLVLEEGVLFDDKGHRIEAGTASADDMR